MANNESTYSKTPTGRAKEINDRVGKIGSKLTGKMQNRPSPFSSIKGGQGVMAIGRYRAVPTGTIQPTITGRPKTIGDTGVRKPTTPMMKAAPKAAPKASPSKPTEITIPGGGLKTARSKAVGNMGGGGLGVSSGKTTGSSVTRGGTGGRTGGRGNAGPAGMGASGRGTGGKK